MTDAGAVTRWPHLAIFLLALLLPLIASAAAIDVTSGSRISADADLSWCATEAAVNVSAVRDGACVLQPARPGDLARGLDRRAFWLRATLLNPAAHPIERWVFVGHPRLEEVSLFVDHPSQGWLQRDIGIRTPLSRRDEIGRAYGVIALILPPASEQTVWLRVTSRTAIDLSTTLWTPAEFREASGRNQFSLTLAVGALFVVMLLSGLAFVATREWSYLAFALSMLGEIVLEGFRTGLLQRFFLPPDLAMPVQTAAFGSLLAVTGFTVFFHRFVPTLTRTGWLYRLFSVLVGLTVLAQFWSIFADYRDGAMVWSFSVNGVILVGITLAISAWRDGMASAGTLVLSFAFLAVLELLRLGAVVGWLPFFWAETMAGPWALVMTTPLMLLSVFQRSRELHDKLLRAELENSAKVEFLAQISHELRTPLDTILGNAQLLARPAGGILAPEGLETIQQSGRHLLGMIDEILDHARGLAGKLTLQPAPVCWPDFLRQMERNARLLAGANDNEFSLVQEGERIGNLLLDEGRLRQVLDNLLINAARHTRNGTIVLVAALRRLPDERAQLDFCVTDSGDGVAPEDQERIFLPFVRGSNTIRSGGKGTGMGLAISRQLVAAMGGALRVESESGQGASFTFGFTCPISEPVPEAASGADFSDYAGRRRQILVVDDQADSLRILTSLLVAHGFTTLVAASGRQAIEEIQRIGAVDLVLVDQFMADGDGWRVLREIAESGQSIPVVLMSSALPERPDDHPPELDFSAFLLKPLDHSTLLRVVGQLLRLDWQDAEPVKVTATAATLVPEEKPDEDALQTLRQLIDRGAVSDMMDWAIALKASQPRYSGFADQVHAAVRRIDFPALQTLAGMAP